MDDQRNQDAERHHLDAGRQLLELSELFDLAAIPQAGTLVERARLFLRIAGDARQEATQAGEALDIYRHLDPAALSSLKRRAAGHGQCPWDLLNVALLELVAQPDDQYVYTMSRGLSKL